MMLKKLIFLFFVLTLPVFGTDLPADFIDGNTLTASELNNWKEERDGDFLPISQFTKNFITASCNIGSSTYKWNALYLNQYAYFGADVTLYRSAADILKTDDSLTVALGLNIGAATGASTGQVRTSSLALSDFSLDRWDSASDDGSLYINYYGYNGGITKFRDLHICNGKSADIALFDGSDKSSYLYGGLNVGTATGAAVGQVRTSSLALSAFSLDRWDVNSDTAFYLNYYSYNGLLTQFRDLIVANGKGVTIALFDGSERSMTVYGAITATGNVSISGGINIGTSTGATTGSLKASGSITSTGNIYTSGTAWANGNIYTTSGYIQDTDGSLNLKSSSDGSGFILTNDIFASAGDQIRILNPKTPSSASDTGVKGTICWDTSFIYVCIATNTWKKVAIATW